VRIALVVAIIVTISFPSWDRFAGRGTLFRAPFHLLSLGVVPVVWRGRPSPACGRVDACGSVMTAWPIGDAPSRSSSGPTIVVVLSRPPARSLLLGLGFALIAAAFAFFTDRWFLRPHVDSTLETADAIVVFPGGPEEDARFRRGLELMDQGLAPVLFVATDTQQSELERSICQGTAGAFPTACRLSQPRNTFGNSLATSEEAAARGWESIILVTADDHIARSHMLLSRCFDGRIQTAASETSKQGWRRVGRVVYEWAAMGKALFVDRC
jgi:uncharacterized SAM-binding protein YcdF (DUF218 family)